MFLSSSQPSKFQKGDKIVHKNIPEYGVGEIIGPYGYWDDQPGEVWYKVWIHDRGLVFEEKVMEFALLEQLASL